MAFPAAIPAFVNLLALAARRRRTTPSIHYYHYGRALCATMASSNKNCDASENQDRFNKMEHRNWEQGYEAYDQGFGPLTRQTIATLLENADFPPAGGEESAIRLLDVATGPGFVLSAAINAAENTDGDLRYGLTGLDITRNFLTLASRRIGSLMQQQQRTKNINVDFVEGSAESLPFPECTFDSIVCNFGILHFFNPGIFLRESYRVLRPGGKVSFTAWCPPTRTEGFNIALEAIAEAGNPKVEGLPDGPNFFDFGDPEQATAVLREIGFEDAHSIEMSEMKWTNVKNGSMLYDVLLNGTSRTREVLLGQTAEEAAAIQASMVQKYDTLTNGGKRLLSMPALVTSGRKPI